MKYCCQVRYDTKWQTIHVDVFHAVYRYFVEYTALNRHVRILTPQGETHVEYCP